MYSVTTRVEFCYGHRLLDYDGPCRHLHGHNGVAEIEIRTADLDARGMAADFVDVYRRVKDWIDREIDHRMILRRDDPLAAPLGELGQPVFLVDVNPTAESLARLIFDVAAAGGLPVVRVTVWETPDASASCLAPGTAA